MPSVDKTRVPAHVSKQKSMQLGVTQHTSLSHTYLDFIFAFKLLLPVLALWLCGSFWNCKTPPLSPKYPLTSTTWSYLLSLSVPLTLPRCSAFWSMTVNTQTENHQPTAFTHTVISITTFTVYRYVLVNSNVCYFTTLGAKCVHAVFLLLGYLTHSSGLKLFYTP